MNTVATENDTWSVSITKLMVNVDGKWVVYGRPYSIDTLQLRVYYDQMFIIQNDKILERTSGKVKAYFKDDIVIIIYCNANKKMRKLKFQLKTNDLNSCIKKLQSKFPVIYHKRVPTSIPLVFKDVGEVLKSSMDSAILGNEFQNMDIPANYEDFIKVCLLDPSFPQLVAETQKVLNNISTNI